MTCKPCQPDLQPETATKNPSQSCVATKLLRHLFAVLTVSPVQINRVTDLLRRHFDISEIEALDYGCFASLTLKHPSFHVMTEKH